MHTRGSAKVSFGVPDSPKPNLDPLLLKLVPAWGSPRTVLTSNVVLHGMDKGGTQPKSPPNT